MFQAFGIEVTGSSLALGTITGMTYGILAVGLILIYRSNKIINFAHGEIGAFSAAVFGALVTQGELHYWLAFPVAIAFGAGLGAVTEFGAVRRLKNAPAVMSAVVTLALAGVLVTLTTVVNIGSSAGYQYPEPRWFPEFFIGGLLVTQAHVAMLGITPLLVVGLTLFLQRSRFGMAIRASAANSDAARLAAVPVAQMSTMAWAIAGGVSAYTAILIFPTRGFVSTEVLGPALLLRALTAAVIGRMTSLPIGFIAGVGIGVLEHLLLWNFPRGGLISAVLFAVILVALLLQQRQRGRDEDRAGWSSVTPWAPLPDAVRKLWAVRNLGWIAGGVALLSALALPVFVTHSISILLVGLIAFALVGLSLGITTGLGGQLSLGQFAVAGVGAAASYLVGTRSGAFAIGLLAAGIAGSLVSLLIGLPALRIRSLMLTVTTLGFALAAQDWLFQQDWMLGSGVDPGRPILGGLALDSGKSYYVFAVAIAAICTWLARNVWRSGVGRRLRAVRDNEDAARSFTIPATSLKLQGFLLAGFLAGIGGAVYGHSLSQISSTTFLMAASIDVAMLAVVGGIGVLAGPIVGALFVIGVPLLPLDNAGLAATKLGLLLVVLYFPGGVAELLRPFRDAVVGVLARRAGVSLDTSADETIERRPISLEALAGDRPHSSEDGVLLDVNGAVKHYGGIKAVDGVSLQVFRGETVGLIGPNGAGKTTLFELIGGFVPSDDGTFAFDGTDVTKQGAEARGRLGLIRSFQDAALFPTMTTLEVVMLAMERTGPTRVMRALAGFHGPEKRKEQAARDHIGAMGLWDYRDKQIRELSTGTRRIVEIASLLVLRPTLLLLDEPSAGIAQREVEALQALLGRIRRELSLTLLVIEHDVPMIMALSHRIIAMDTGKVIATGTPEEIRTHPDVVRSYLGGDVTTIQRSGVQS